MFQDGLTRKGSLDLRPEIGLTLASRVDIMRRREHLRVRRRKMPLAKQTWDVVAFGRWNPGILTPKGIVARLFDPAQPTNEMEIEFPEDAVGPCRVNYEGLAISVTDSVLAVQPKNQTYADLHRAMAAVKRAMQNLPETPVSGISITLRYAGQPDEGMAPLGDSLQHPWEERFAECGYTISNRSFSFSVKWDGGTILITLGNKPEIGYRATISFRRSGARDEMLRWLSLNPDILRDQVTAIFQKVFRTNGEAAR